ncbi:MAG: hypothetical protein J7496_02615 [Novosphingobium sp.]|nr:hypothetical protein [Novosphingobium sp.]MBO9601381.1 hypothetical protein [Novosphingobium sp.]
MALALAPALLLGGCGGAKDKPAAKAGADGELGAALGDEIMVDPDLAGQNQDNAAVTVGQGDGTLPPAMLSPEAVDRARSAALELVGGAMKKAPAAIAVSGTLPPEAALAAASRAAAAPGGNGNCADKAGYTMQWAAKLPAAFPVYPQGAVQEAAGTDEGGCALRVVNYLTAMPLDEVIDFYFTRATGAGFSAQRVKQDGDDVLGGVKGTASYIVYARKNAGGGTSVDLVTHGS